MMVPRPVDALQSCSWRVSNRNEFVSVSWVTLIVEQLSSRNLQNHLQQTAECQMEKCSVSFQRSSDLPAAASPPPPHRLAIFKSSSIKPSNHKFFQSFINIHPSAPSGSKLHNILHPPPPWFLWFLIYLYNMHFIFHVITYWTAFAALKRRIFE